MPSLTVSIEKSRLARRLAEVNTDKVTAFDIADAASFDENGVW